MTSRHARQGPAAEPTAPRGSLAIGLVLAVLPVGVALNVTIGLLVHVLKLPVYLDSIGTVLIAFLLGPLWAAAAGAASMVLGGVLLNPWMPYYAGTAALTGILAGLYARAGWQRSVRRAVALGIVVAVAATIASAPVTVLVFGGVTGAGSTAIVAFLTATGHKLLESVLVTGFSVEILDKVITCLLPCLVVRALPVRVSSRFPLLPSTPR